MAGCWICNIDIVWWHVYLFHYAALDINFDESRYSISERGELRSNVRVQFRKTQGPFDLTLKTVSSYDAECAFDVVDSDEYMATEGTYYILEVCWYCCQVKLVVSYDTVASYDKSGNMYFHCVQSGDEQTPSPFSSRCFSLPLSYFLSLFLLFSSLPLIF